MAVGKPWADGPLTLIQSPVSKGVAKSDASIVATEMSNVHNVFIRALNCILLQAPNITSTKDKKDFLDFCLALTTTIEEHHHTEETLMFPLFESHSRPGLLEQNIVQHSEFHGGLHDFEIYLSKAKNGVTEYSGSKIVSLVQDFATLLTTHLTDEIDTLLKLEEFDVPWADVMRQVTEHAINTPNPYTVIPFVLCCTENDYEEGIHKASWPPFPWFAKMMFPWTHFGKHKGAWRFACCDAYGRRRELPFA